MTSDYEPLSMPEAHPPPANPQTPVIINNAPTHSSAPGLPVREYEPQPTEKPKTPGVVKLGCLLFFVIVIVLTALVVKAIAGSFSMLPAGPILVDGTPVTPVFDATGTVTATQTLTEALDIMMTPEIVILPNPDDIPWTRRPYQDPTATATSVPKVIYITATPVWPTAIPDNQNGLSKEDTRKAVDQMVAEGPAPVMDLGHCLGEKATPRPDTVLGTVPGAATIGTGNPINNIYTGQKFYLVGNYADIPILDYPGSRGNVLGHVQSGDRVGVLFKCIDQNKAPFWPVFSFEGAGFIDSRYLVEHP